MQPRTIRLLQTTPHRCGYLPDRQTRNVVLDPASTSLHSDYPRALALGFRRTGPMVYRPHCDGCRACVPCRIRVADFGPDRSQRRCLKRNADLTLEIALPGYTDERHALYRRYMRARHPGGGMDPAKASDFHNFLDADWSPTVFLELRLRDRLLAVAATDVCATGLSAVYTFFEPDQDRRSLGTLAILKQIELARKKRAGHVYLGYWIAGHPKMDYKSRFSGVELFDGRQWRARDSV